MTSKGLCLFMEGHKVEPCGVCCPECGYAKNKKYVPKKGDIVVHGKTLKLITDINNELGTLHYTDYSGIGTVVLEKYFVSHAKPIGLSLERIREEYISREELKERDEKLIIQIEEKIKEPCPDAETLIEKVKKVFASVAVLPEKKEDKKW